MDTILEFAPLVHLVTVISFLLLLVGASQVRHEDFLINILLKFTGASIFYSAYRLFTLTADDPWATELEVFKKIAIFFIFSLSISLALVAAGLF